MKTVSYKEYQKEVNKKKKSNNTSKTKTSENIVKEKKPKESINKNIPSNTSKKKDTDITKVKVTENSNKEKNVIKSINTKLEKDIPSNTSKKKDTDITKVKVTENIIEEKNIIQSVDNKKEIYNTDRVNIYQEKSIDTNLEQNIDEYPDKNNLNSIINKEELNKISENSNIKILDDKELNQIIKLYEKDIKKENPKKKKKKRRIRWNNVTLLMFILIFLTTLIISSTKIINWLKDSKNSEEVIIEIQENTEIIETENNEETEIIEIPEEVEKEIPKTSPYWTYIEMNLIDVDFSELKQKNSDTAGWIQVNGTNINYPYVQTSDNAYYLTHSFDKTTNSAGWVFMDYRNNKSDFDKNTIIYAHSRKNNTMFGTLRKILKNGWLNNTNNHVIKLSTEYENTLWQVFSVYRIPTTNDYIQVSFVNDQEFINFGNMLLERSAYNFNTSISSEDKILTLSTCYDDYDKVVLHAKLIKREKK